MLSAWVLKSIGIIVISFLLGFAFFYATSPLPKTERKQQLAELASLLINFVIFIWVGKILVNFSVLIQDPLAVLAYPSNSSAFYIATLLIAVNVGYKVKKDNFKAEILFTSFVPVFFSASFVYEFIQIAWTRNIETWGNLGMLMLLLIGYMLFQDKILSSTFAFLLFGIWILGQIVLVLSLSYTTVYGYLMAPWFLVLLLIIVLALYIYNNRRKVS